MVHDRGRPILTIKYDHICIGVSVSELHLYRIGSVQIISVSDRIGIFPHRSITTALCVMRH